MDKLEIYDEPTDEEKEEVIDKILEWDLRLTNLQRMTQRKPQYKLFPYQDYNLYDLSKIRLKRIFRNIINQICDILWQVDHDIESYTKYRPKRYKLKPGFAKYFTTKIAPRQLAEELFPHFLREVTIDEIDIEYLHFLGANLATVCQQELLKLEWLIENEKVKESDVIKTIRKSLLQRSADVDPQLRREVEDELIRHELSHKPEKQKKQLVEFYRQYSKIMAEREKDSEKQQEQILSDGLRRRQELEELKKTGRIKRKERLGTSAAEELCRRLSSESRRKTTRK